MTTQATSASMDMATTVTVLRDLPGIAELEANQHVPNAKWAAINDDFDARAEKVSRAVFGFTKAQTEYAFPTGWYDDGEFYGIDAGAPGAVELPDAEQERIYADAADWEEHFDLLLYSFPEQRPVWDAIGWDVTDGREQPLLVLNHFARQIVVKAKGLRPHVIVATEADILRESESWAAALEAEARKFSSGGRR